MYDAQGNPFAADVVEVTALEPPEKGDLLRSKGSNRMVWKDRRLYYPRGFRFTAIEVTADAGRDARGRRARFTEKLELYGCRHRVSLEYGSGDAGVDVAATTVRGRISGCSLDGDWWVRAIPMFGGQVGFRVIFEGYLHRSDGSFQITAAMRGERHIITIGRGRDPVASFGADVVAGGSNNDVGTIDLRGKCPS